MSTGIFDLLTVSIANASNLKLKKLFLDTVGYDDCKCEDVTSLCQGDASNLMINRNLAALRARYAQDAI